MFSRKTHYELDYEAVLSLFLLYFPLAACALDQLFQWTSGAYLVIGASLGRVAGLAITDLTGSLYQEPGWNWIDPEDLRSLALQPSLAAYLALQFHHCDHDGDHQRHSFLATHYVCSFNFQADG